MTKKTEEQVKARMELDKLEAQIDGVDVTRGAEHCNCDNPGCSGVEVVTYGVAVGSSFAGGVSG